MLPEQSLTGVYEWFTQRRSIPKDLNSIRWEALRNRLEDEGKRPWTYAMFMIHYDTVMSRERATKLIRHNYVLSPETMDRFLQWCDSYTPYVKESVHRQLAYMRNQYDIGMEPDWLLGSNCIDVNVMVRFDMAVEWRSELETPHGGVLDLFGDRAIEMYMGLPWYEELTPRACNLILDKL